MTDWTTPAALRAQVQKWWDRGDILAGLVTQQPAFPKRLALKCPSSSELLDHFDQVRAWDSQLREMPHIRLTLREIRHRVLGINALPHGAWIDTAEAAIALIGKQHEAALFTRLIGATRERQPALLAWLNTHPAKALALAADWERLLDVVAWLKDHPRPGIYLRQMDLPGVHSKFVENHRGVLGDLLDLALPMAAIDPLVTGLSRFAQRYGFKDKPERIRFRVLDVAHHLLPGDQTQDITLNADSFACLKSGISDVFITENEINFLAFPAAKQSMVIFGAGYGFAALGKADWLKQCRIHYWGDIDTHAFAILDELRGHFPHAESFLMDKRTLLQFESLWGHEEKPAARNLTRLTPMENALYDDLRGDRIRPNLRLEQERIRFGWMLAALESRGLLQPS